MYLKEIKAHGFKSFADNISIELNRDITGIVGPNGSGKSNVVDAVRWVLGEQSVKSLRGEGNMTDVIFSGSKSRNGAGSATVTIVIDNSDHYLPVDFNEVSIKRRVYKDGTNEYYLNNEKCRLKDITDLLLDSGMAKESFNIISQGKVEEIFSNKPQDRRVIFEEAAGVLKYKKRKEDALRKLDRTHDNLDRINDIISELAIQVEPLKKQKEEALKYLAFKEELDNIEIALITEDITKINYKYKTKKEKITELNEALLNISASNSGNEAKIEEYKLNISKIAEELSHAQKELLSITTKVEKINSQKAIILERKKYEVDDTKLHNNVVELKEKELKLNSEINKLELEITSLKKEIEDKNNDLSQEKSKIEEIKNTKRNLEIELSGKYRNDSFLKNKIENLKTSIENNANMPFAIKAVLENPKLQGIHNIIGKVIEVENEHSIAISTALGANSNNIIVDNEEAAKDAIKYLKTANLGRATFFPLNIIKPKAIDPETQDILNKIDGYIDVASNLVKFDKTYYNIILNQLGNVIISKDIDSANKISKKINYRYRVVTLDGELLHVGGSITGGNQAKSKNIINDKYDLEKALKDEQQNIDNIKEIENKINDNDYLLKSVEDKEYLINKEKLQLEEILINKNSSLKELNEKLQETTNEIKGTSSVIDNVLAKEEEEILNSYYEAINEKEKIVNNISNLSKEKEKLDNELEEFEFNLKKENSLFNSTNKELKELEIEVNRMDVKLDSLLNTLNEEYSMTYENASKKYKLELEESEARTKVNTLKRSIREIGVVNLAAPDEYDRVSERYEFLIKQREDLINAENTLLEIISEMDEVMEKEFMETFKIIRENFITTFKELFRGGNADLKLTDPDNILETGIEIIASPPGKKLSSITLLSGGEKTFTAISLLFAILKSKPVPFCILDEVEAALDEVNVDSFGNYLHSLKEKTQFILITHKKKTMEHVDTLYGITMQESGVSKLVSVKLEDIK